MWEFELRYRQALISYTHFLHLVTPEWPNPSSLLTRNLISYLYTQVVADNCTVNRRYYSTPQLELANLTHKNKVGMRVSVSSCIWREHHKNWESNISGWTCFHWACEICSVLFRVRIQTLIYHTHSLPHTCNCLAIIIIIIMEFFLAFTVKYGQFTPNVLHIPSPFSMFCSVFHLLLIFVIFYI